MKTLLRLFLVLLPWPLRRLLLIRCLGYEIHPTATIGRFAWVFPDRLRMAPGAQIGHLTVCIHLEEIEIHENARLGRLNWVTGFPRMPSRHFVHQPDRVSRLVIERHASITNRHIIDCTGGIRIGEFAKVAGFRSQLLSHGIDVAAGRQHSAPITIGPRCFVGTGCIILGGATLPAFSVLGAGAVLNKAHEQTHTLYAGQPARPIKTLPADCAYFTRATGAVD